MTYPSPSAAAAPMIAPLAGRMCFRSLSDGEAMVGVLQFPRDFTPMEGAIYLMHCSSSNVAIIPEIIPGGITPGMKTYGVGDVLSASIWPRTTSADFRPVTFLLAFPDENRWTVFGPSSFAPPAGIPDHRWVDVRAGILEPIAPPEDVTGLAMSQILTQAPVWPNATGVLHTLPQIPGAGRGVFYRRSRWLAAAAADPELSRTLEERLRSDPELRYIGVGRVDWDYCAYLAALADRGLLDVDRPRSAAEVAQREAISDEILRARLLEEKPVMPGHRVSSSPIRPR